MRVEVESGTTTEAVQVLVATVERFVVTTKVVNIDKIPDQIIDEMPVILEILEIEQVEMMHDIKTINKLEWMLQLPPLRMALRNTVKITIRNNIVIIEVVINIQIAIAKIDLEMTITNNIVNIIEIDTWMIHTNAEIVNIGTIENIENIENIGSIGNIENIGSIGNIGSIMVAINIEVTENTKANHIIAMEKVVTETTKENHIVAKEKVGDSVNCNINRNSTCSFIFYFVLYCTFLVFFIYF